MLKGIIVGVVVTVIILVAAGYAVLRLGVIPANADAQPGGFEQFVANTSLSATLNKDAPRQPNPVPLSDDNLMTGIRLYGDHCVICHGNARGNSSASAIARGEYPSPPQLASEGVEDDPEGWTFWKIKHGIRWTGMPSWKDELNDTQIWTLALFLKHMDKLPPGPEAVWREIGKAIH